MMMVICKLPPSLRNVEKGAKRKARDLGAPVKWSIRPPKPQHPRYPTLSHSLGVENCNEKRRESESLGSFVMRANTISMSTQLLQKTPFEECSVNGDLQQSTAWLTRHAAGGGG